MSDADYRPTADLRHLRTRAEMLGRLRAFFSDRGFLEVETPLLSVDTIVDVHIEPFELSDDGRSRWLQTSPEFAMKRLLASGADAIYQVCKAFRRGESGALHNEEFTLVEWYRAGDSYEAGMQFLAELTSMMLSIETVERLSFASAFARTVGLDPHCADASALCEAAKSMGLSVDEDFSAFRDDWLDLLMSHCVQPHLGVDSPVIVFDYPASQAALAQIRPDDPPVAERFELFYRGVELANGYHELSSAAEFRSRMAANNVARQERGKAALPETSRLLSAMEAGLPACSGCALGWDRLVMLALEANSLEQVIAFPGCRA